MKGFGPLKAIFLAEFFIGKHAALIERVVIQDKVFDLGAVGGVVVIAEKRQA